MNSLYIKHSLNVSWSDFCHAQIMKCKSHPKMFNRQHKHLCLLAITVTICWVSCKQTNAASLRSRIEDENQVGYSHDVNGATPTKILVRQKRNFIHDIGRGVRRVTSTITGGRILGGPDFNPGGGGGYYGDFGGYVRSVIHS